MPAFNKNNTHDSSIESGNHQRQREIPLIPLDPDMATVQYTLSHRKFGRILFQGVSWKAKCRLMTLCLPQSSVRVLYRQGNTLVVEPVDRNQFMSSPEG